jgi:TRAP-type C4-dicarboxylate transport system substrate-binding protein
MRLGSVAALAVVIAAGPALGAPVELKFSYPGPPQAKTYAEGVLPWIEQVNKEAGGAIEIKPYVGMTLATPTNVYDRVLNGVADFGFGLSGLYPQQFPRTMVAMLPFETRSGGEAAVALWTLYQKGVIAAEYATLKPLALSAFANISFHSRKPVGEISDFKGLRISTDSRVMAQVISRLGAAPVTMPPTDIYQALQRGTIDASGIGWPGILPFKLNEVVHYHLDAAVAAGALFNIMNKDSYAKLPEKGRAAIDKLGGMNFSQIMGRAVDAMNADGLNYTKHMPNQTISTLSPQQEAEWRKLTQPVTDEWVKTTPDGAKVLAAYREEIKAIRAGK